MKNETELSRAVQRHIRKLGGHARKVHAGGYTGPGEPDIDACIAGRCVKVELKMPGKRPTPTQMGAMRRWAKAGALVGWVTSIEELDELLSHVDDLTWQNPQLVRGVDERVVLTDATR